MCEPDPKPRTPAYWYTLLGALFVLIGAMTLWDGYTGKGHASKQHGVWVPPDQTIAMGVTAILGGGYMVYRSLTLRVKRRDDD